MEASRELKPRFSFEFEVEKILGVSNDGTYRVQWAPAWVNRTYLTGCEHLIQQFLQQQSQEIKSEPEFQLESSDVRYHRELSGKQFDSTLAESQDRRTRIGIDPYADLCQLPDETRPVNTWTVTEELVGHQSEPCATQGGDEDDECMHIESNYVNKSTEKKVVSSSLVSMENESSKNRAADVHVICLQTAEDSAENSLGFANESTNDSYFTGIGIGSSSVLKDDLAKSRNLPLGFNVQEYSIDQRAPSSKQLLFKERNEHCHSSQQQEAYLHDERFECHHCSNVFVTRYELKRHMRVHTAEKAYSCEHCDYSCNRKGNLKRHMRIHTGERPYPCNICGRSFALNFNLKHHLRTHVFP